MGAKFLNLITKGRIKSARFIVLYGVEGIGKTTFAARFPNVIFAGPESSNQFDVSRLPRPGSWDEFLEQLADLLDPEYTFKTLAIDSLDWLEILLHEKMKRQYKVDQIEDCSGGYGKWVGEACRHVLNLTKAIDMLKVKKGMDVVALAHYHIKTFNDPNTTLPYDRYQMKMNDKCAAVIREAADCVFFANFKTSSFSKDSKARKGRGVSDGARCVYTEKRAAHDAKNRYSMPYEVSFDYDTIMNLINMPPAEQIDQFKKDITDLLIDFEGNEKHAVMKAHFEKIQNDLPSLQVMKNRLKTILGELTDDTATIPESV